MCDRDLLEWLVHFCAPFYDAGYAHCMPCTSYEQGTVIAGLGSLKCHVAAALRRAKVFTWLVQRSYSPAWVHANFKLGRDKKQAFLAQHAVWTIDEAQEYPICAPATESFSALE